MTISTGFYSYKGQEPSFLPHRITLSDGRSRTDTTTFTLEEIQDAGFTGPYEIPEYDEETQEVNWDSESLSWLVNDKELPPIYEPTEEELMEMVRMKRNLFLSNSDWTQLPDSSLTVEIKNKWKEYRQVLRDLPQTIDDVKEFDINLDFPVPNF